MKAVFIGVFLCLSVHAYTQNRCLNFDGQNDYVNLDELVDVLAGQTEFTVEFWLRAGLDQSNVRVVPFAINKTGQYSNRFLIVLGGDASQTGNLLIYDNNTGNTGYDILTDEFVADEAWHHIAYRRMGSTGELLLDGVQVANHLADFLVTPDDFVSLGQEYDQTTPSDFFRGDMDELRVWTIYRTDADIASTATAELDGDEPGLVAYYNFNVGTPAQFNGGLTTLSNEEGDAFDGTLFNFSLSGASSNWVCSDIFGLTFGPATFTLGDELTLGCDETLTYSPTANFVSPSAFAWNTGATQSEITVGSSGVYALTITDDGCLYADSVNVTVLGADPDLGSDTCAADGFNITLPAEAGTAYVWQDGSSESSIEVNASGWYAVTVTSDCGTSADSVLVQLAETDVSLGLDAIFCVGETVLLDPGVAGDYAWSTGATSESITINEAGTYGVTITDGLCEYTDEITLETTYAPSVDLGPNFCTLDPVPLAVSPPPFSEVTWQDGSTDTVFTAAAAGFYSVTVSNQCDTASDQVEIDFGAFSLELTDDQIICPGENVTLTALADRPNAQYVWQNGSTENARTVDTGGTYTIEVTVDGCTAVDSVVVTEERLPELSLAESYEWCARRDLLVIEVDSFANVDYQWSSGASGPQLVVLQAGVYELTVSNECGSATYATRVVEREPLAVFDLGPNRPICPGETIALRAVVQGATEFMWQDSSGGFQFDATEPGTYSVVAMDGCTEVRDAVELFAENCCEIFVPNAFSPNGDGQNDRFHPVRDPRTCADLTNYRLEVYDRWGNQVFLTDSPDAGWDGSVRGRRGGTANYVWRLSYMLLGEEMIEYGTVALLR